MSFTYPVEGYLPLQNPPTADLMKAHKLLDYIKNVISVTIDTQVDKATVFFNHLNHNISILRGNIS